MSQRAGHDLNYLAETGLLDLLSKKGAEQVPGLQIADLAGGGLQGALCILAALLKRTQSGEGCHIDLAMQEGVASLLSAHYVATQYGAANQAPTGGLLEGAAASYNVYRSQDGAPQALAALEPKFWQGFVRAVGLDSRVAFVAVHGGRAAEDHAARAML